MSEEAQMLLAKAARNQLSEEEARRWAELCTEDPSLEAELEEAKAVAAELEASLRAQSLSESGLSKLRAARQEVFEPGGESGSKVTRFPGFAWVVVAAAAAVALLLLVLIGPGKGGSPSNSKGMQLTMKNLVTTKDMPLLTPSERTSILDPTFIWMMLDPLAVEVTILDAEKRTPLFKASNAFSRAEWADMEPLGEATTLQPATPYVIRLQQGEDVSERVLQVQPGAQTLKEWLAQSPEDAKEQLREWLNEGQPGDVLTMAQAMMGQSKATDPELSELRSQARQAALLQAKPRP